MRTIILVLVPFFIYSCQGKESKIESLNIEQTVASANCEPDFDVFFQEFSKDFIFQKNHIKFPLSVAYYADEYHEELIVETIETKSDFKYIDFTDDVNAMQTETDKFTTEKVKAKTRATYKRLGYDNGIMVSYKFEIINGCWTMVEVIDEST